MDWPLVSVANATMSAIRLIVRSVKTSLLHRAQSGRSAMAARRTCELAFPAYKKAYPDFAKTSLRIRFPVSRAVRLQLCRQSTVLVAKSSAQGNPLSDIGSVKDRPHLAVSG
jgi:hypothetical protein